MKYLVTEDEFLSANVDGNGDLTFTRDNGQIVTAGNVTVPKGVITSPQVARIIALVEGDPLPPLVNGDLVIRYTQPGNIYYKDFSGDEIGEEPTGLTLMFGDATKVRGTVETATGGKSLQVGGTSGSIGYSITESLDDPFLDNTEILIKWWHDGATHGASTWHNLDAVAESSYRASYNVSGSAGKARITVQENGATLAAPETTIPLFASQAWYFTRSRVESGVAMVKHWPAIEEEPEWQQVATVAPLDAGAVAFGRQGTSAAYYLDWIVVATGGKTAVKP